MEIGTLIFIFFLFMIVANVFKKVQQFMVNLNPNLGQKAINRLGAQSSPHTGMTFDDFNDHIRTIGHTANRHPEPRTPQVQPVAPRKAQESPRAIPRELVALGEEAPDLGLADNDSWSKAIIFSEILQPCKARRRRL